MPLVPLLTPTVPVPDVEPDGEKFWAGKREPTPALKAPGTLAVTAKGDPPTLFNAKLRFVKKFVAVESYHEVISLQVCFVLVSDILLSNDLKMAWPPPKLAPSNDSFGEFIYV